MPKRPGNCTEGAQSYTRAPARWRPCIWQGQTCIRWNPMPGCGSDRCISSPSRFIMMWPSLSDIRSIRC
nr:MAG TPA: hypothetical protein [Caudoviricetes sp.]